MTHQNVPEDVTDKLLRLGRRATRPLCAPGRSSPAWLQQAQPLPGRVNQVASESAWLQTHSAWPELQKLGLKQCVWSNSLWPRRWTGILLNSLTSSLVFQGYLSVMNSDGLGSCRLLAQYILDSWTEEERPLTEITGRGCSKMRCMLWIFSGLGQPVNLLRLHYFLLWDRKVQRDRRDRAQSLWEEE